MKKLLVLLMLSCLPVFASNWYQVGYKSYLDYDSWNYSNGITTVWFKDLNPGDWKPINNKKVWYSLSRTQFNCSAKSYNFLSVIDYGLDGKVLNSYNFDFGNWQTIPPDTIIEGKYKFVCGN